MRVHSCVKTGSYAGEPWQRKRGMDMMRDVQEEKESEIRQRWRKGEIVQIDIHG